MEKRNSSELKPRDILCFSDVMDNLADFSELDIVPKSYVQMLKEDKSKHLTIIEYSSSQLAVVENNLLICNEALEKYYKICSDILIEFRMRMNGIIYKEENPSEKILTNVELIDEKFRKKFIENLGFKNWIYNEIDIENLKKNQKMMSKISKGKTHKKETAEKYGMDKMYLKIVELASKILLCFNGELALAYNTRLDLFLMNFLKDFHNELRIVNLSLKKFRKCYVGWYYRRILCSICILREKDSFVRSAKSRNFNIESKDFGRLKLFWGEEYDRIMDGYQTKKKSYKLWEYLTLFQRKMKNEIFELMSHEFKEMRTEVEIFLIENFLNYYEKAKKICSDDVHNNCAFEYLNSILRLLFEMKIDEFMDDEKFYENFMEDHKYWVDELLKHFENLNIENREEREKWAGLTMVDFSKLESLKAHKNVVYHWKEYLNFCLMTGR